MVQKLSKDVFYEIDQVEQQVQRLKKRVDQGNNQYQTLNGTVNHGVCDNNVNASGVLLGSAIDPNMRSDIRDVRQSVEHIY